MPDTFHHALPVGSHIEHYEIRSVLGAGGFGVTYLGWDSRLHQQVAIKEYLPADIAMRQADGSNVIAKSSQDRDNYQYGLDRFLNEARTLAKFREPNLIRVQAFLEANGTAYMVMDYEEGETLSAYLDRIGTLEEATLKGIIIPILDGLRAVHAADFLHRDIKPGNIYLRRNGPPVLIDFGAARQALGEHSRSMTGIVTAGYAPFEQYSTRGKQGPWTDLYAIGATMYRCISGHAPVESAERMAAFSEGEADPLVPASELKQGQFSTELLSAIDWMLKPAAKDRPQRVEEVLGMLLGKVSSTDLDEPITDTTVHHTAPAAAFTSSSPTSPVLPELRTPKFAVLLIGLVVLVAGIVGAGVWGYMSRDQAASTSDSRNVVNTPKSEDQITTQGVASNKAVASSGVAVLEPTMVSMGYLVSMVSMGSFAIGKYEVTQGQWKAVMGNIPSDSPACIDDCPVVEVSWDDVQVFLKKLNKMSGKHYRLPTDREWEHACGIKNKYCGSNDIDSVAWTAENSQVNLHQVGLKQPNDYGLYDMIGNVWEWTSSCWGVGGDCSVHVIRGGSYYETHANLSAEGGRHSRGSNSYKNRDLGFRLAHDT